MARRTAPADRAGQNRIIVVLGMHRSGTSALARGLGALGFSLGDKLKETIAGANDKGFWEDAELSQVNDDLFIAADRRWDGLDLMNAWAPDERAQQPHRERALALLRERLQRYPLFAFKDPRTSIALPFWQPIFSELHASVSYVISFRHPLAVALSLEQRDKFDRFKACHLWLMYTLAAVEHTNGAQRVFVDYDDLLEEPAAQLKRIARALGLAADAPDSEDASRYAKEFLDQRLRHHRASAVDLAKDQSCPQLVADVYAHLRKEARSAGAAGKSNDAEWLKLLDRMLDLAPYATRLEADVQANSRLAALADGQQIAKAELTALKHMYERDRATWSAGEAAARQHVEGLNRHATEIETYLNSLKAELAKLRQSCEADAKAWGTERGNLENYLNSLTAELAKLRQSYEADAKAWRAERGNFQTQLAATEARAGDAETYAKSLAGELTAVRTAYEAEHAAFQSAQSGLEAERAARGAETEELRRYLASVSRHAGDADAYAKSLAIELENVRRSYETERAAWKRNEGEIERYVSALKQQAEEASRYAKSLAASLESERASWSGGRTALQAHIDAIEQQLKAFERHWPYQLLKIPKPTLD